MQPACHQMANEVGPLPGNNEVVYEHNPRLPLVGEMLGKISC